MILLFGEPDGWSVFNVLPILIVIAGYKGIVNAIEYIKFKIKYPIVSETIPYGIMAPDDRMIINAMPLRVISFFKDYKCPITMQDERRLVLIDYLTFEQISHKATCLMDKNFKLKWSKNPEKCDYRDEYLNLVCPPGLQEKYERKIRDYKFDKKRQLHN